MWSRTELISIKRVVVLEDARDVCVELAALLVAQELATAFRGEHEMNNDVGEGLGHGGVFYRVCWRCCKPAM